MGFVILATIIITYTILITKIIYIAKTAKDNIGSYIAIGITGILCFHMFENIGMTMGVLPITGVPLPFVSYRRKFTSNKLYMYRFSIKY